MTPPQGVFVPFFGIPACTASGLARVALHTDAAAIPAFTIWDSVLRRYRVRFDPALTLIRTGDGERDVIENTALFTKVIEDYVRQYPDEWLWGAQTLEDSSRGPAATILKCSPMKLKLIAQALQLELVGDGEVDIATVSSMNGDGGSDRIRGRRESSSGSIEIGRRSDGRWRVRAWWDWKAITY